MNKSESGQPDETAAANDHSQTTTPLPDDWRVREAMKIVREEMHLHLTLTEVAARVRLSTHRLRHVFRDHTGLSFNQYLKRIRLETACHLLVTQELTVEEIVDRIGFRGLNHFTVDFKKEYGISPGTYRKCYLIKIHSATNGH